MSKTYDPAPPEVYKRVAALIASHYPELASCGIKIDLIFAATDQEGSAVTLHGYPCLATVRVIPLKERAMLRGDAEIVIDRDKYASLDDAEADALLDHELYHLDVQRDGKGRIKTDTAMRPMLRCRLHDRQFGWFDAIARRHGPASNEVRQAKEFFSEAGQLYFDLSEVAGSGVRLHAVNS